MKKKSSVLVEGKLLEGEKKITISWCQLPNSLGLLSTFYSPNTQVQRRNKRSLPVLSQSLHNPNLLDRLFTPDRTRRHKHAVCSLERAQEGGATMAPGTVRTYRPSGDETGLTASPTTVPLTGPTHLLELT